ncbi:hypothetical protein [Natrinema amylolyticum]|uniref:hypothetical protein n=1 Tax=Natrinema amylolyticum TaxID=2878679 RepID=UPI001CFA7B73|nr:hypothetical protein [Natrinema amylolyticum]
MPDPAVALCIGVLCGIMLHIYDFVLSSCVETHINERIITVLNILVIGGGSGVMVWLTDSYFSSFVYGLAGVVLVLIVVVIGQRW